MGSNEMKNTGERIVTEEKRKSMTVSQILLVAILIAAGVIMKLFIGSLFSAGMKPNFAIAMYCLAILLVRPNIKEAVIIGLLTGVVSQFFLPGAPYLNLVSEPIGAAVMAILVNMKHRLGGPLMPAVTTFITTVVSGSIFALLIYALFFTGGSSTAPAPFAVFLGIIFGTAAVNCVIVQILYIPIAHVLKVNVKDSK